LIAADLRCVAGDGELVELLRRHIITYADTHPIILQAMLNNTLRHKIVLNVFGQLLVEPYGDYAGCVDVKYGGYIPIINSIRLVAILTGIHETSSAKRIKALFMNGDISEEQKQSWYVALQTVLYLRAQTSFEIVDNHYVSAGMIPQRNLSKTDKLQLKMALQAGRKLQKFVQKRINILGG
jgi:CBS domain-containing protein